MAKFTTDHEYPKFISLFLMTYLKTTIANIVIVFVATVKYLYLVPEGELQTQINK